MSPLKSKLEAYLNETLGKPGVEVSEAVTLEAAAKHVGLPTRTMQRHLLNAGTGYAIILDTTRKRLAPLWIDSGIAFGEIARMMGYRNYRSFTMSFSRWFGMVPRDYLARSKADVANRAGSRETS